MSLSVDGISGVILPSFLVVWFGGRQIHFLKMVFRGILLLRKSMLLVEQAQQLSGKTKRGELT